VDNESIAPLSLNMSSSQILHMTYTQATQRLQEIVASLESGTLDIDKLAAQIKEAQQLLAFCKDRLTATSQELENILNNEQE
jgi:exodeoxyribonuclease VII small subunit